ncbi:MAG: tetratricopeptide repeat protein [Bacteroidia bacterium]
MPENDKINLAYTYCLLGKVYKTTSDYPAAINNYSTALQMATTIQDNFSIALAYGGLGDVYQAQGNYAEALKNFKMGVESLSPFPINRNLPGCTV